MNKLRFLGTILGLLIGLPLLMVIFLGVFLAFTPQGTQKDLAGIVSLMAAFFLFFLIIRWIWALIWTVTKRRQK